MEIPQEEIPIDQDAEDEPSGEDLMGDNMERDYVAQPELDRLDGQDLDDQRGTWACRISLPWWEL